MKRAALFLALALAAGSSQAGNVSCEVGSDYDVNLSSGKIQFNRDEGSPSRIEIDRARLRIDGKEVALSAADRERMERYASGLLAMEPEVKAVALDAVDIAFTALSEVARGLSSDSDPMLATLSEVRGRVEREIRTAPESVINEDAFGDAVGDAVAELIPALVGNIVKEALSAAFSGDMARAESLEARAQKLEAEIERRIEPRARALEVRTKRLCEQVAELDAIESEFEYRLPGGEPLDILRSGPG